MQIPFYRRVRSTVHRPRRHRWYPAFRERYTHHLFVRVMNKNVMMLSHGGEMLPIKQHAGTESYSAGYGANAAGWRILLEERRPPDRSARVGSESPATGVRAVPSLRHTLKRPEDS